MMYRQWIGACVYGNRTIGQKLVRKISIARDLFWILVIIVFASHCALWKELERKNKYLRPFKMQKCLKLGVEVCVYGFRIHNPTVYLTMTS